MLAMTVSRVSMIPTSMPCSSLPSMRSEPVCAMARSRPIVAIVPGSTHFTHAAPGRFTQYSLVPLIRTHHQVSVLYFVLVHAKEVLP